MNTTVAFAVDLGLLSAKETDVSHLLLPWARTLCFIRCFIVC